MGNVIQLSRQLQARPTPPEIAGIRLRPYRGREDIATWLDIRRRTFGRQKVGVRDWQECDFEREFLEKPWWRPGAMWFAESQRMLLPDTPVATVTLARRGTPPGDKPVVHWLCVLPGFRRRGIGRLLIATLEAAVWDAGGRQVWLETHSGWAEAARLYADCGYEPVDG
jgi:GNAT superfamily N-acetyltransferase